MSSARAAVLAFCTLLIGAGLGYGAANLGGSRRMRRRRARSRRPRWARPRCPAAAGSPPARQEETFGCYQRAFRAIVDAQDPGVALDDLDALYKSDAYVKRTCHPLAHEIGHLAYAKYKSVTAAEQYARETCWSGYHHGLMESYISQFDDKQLRTKMNGICTQDPSHPYSLAYYNCWHGLGHGLTIRFTQDIFHALRFCNVIRHSWERQSCYSGVFMQNIVANGSGMHRASRPQAERSDLPVRRRRRSRRSRPAT